MQHAPRSLAWQGDDLVSWTAGGRRWGPDGTEGAAEFFWGFPFDAATVPAPGPYRVVYQERGTKGVLLEGRRVVRELNRSFSHATSFDYPVALGRLGDGRDVVVHCPDEYHTLQIEDARSGERLTAGAREPEDVFHSRLGLSPDGRHLLSIGWFWQPFGTAQVFDTAQALADPATLDGEGVLPCEAVTGGEVSAGCWLDADRLVLATGREEWYSPDEEPEALPVLHLGVWSVSGRRWLHRSPVPEPGVLLLPRGDQVVTLHGHPRLLDTVTGRVLAQWPDVAVPTKSLCYSRKSHLTPVAALHPDGSRLAVVQAEGIAVVTLP
ncbi:hypothetical protein [Streptomyces sp. NRRL F-5123]|uniref:hypothetical protein n=1 Tax=Streptomyces sp. NRRL F-5123 TaxID=1463856 RepID=UPI001F3159A3|nr:hypothetical protein [Streptomyces sp. NRRL F-5123]